MTVREGEAGRRLAVAFLGSTAPGLAVRRRRPELMDDPGLDRAQHLRALLALRRINRVSLVARRVWIEALRLHRILGRSVRVLDLACGGGDVLVSVARSARRAGVPVEPHGCDLSPVAVEEGRRAAASLPEVKLFHLDVLHAELPPDYDLLTCSLFLHHLDDDEAARLLRRMAERCRHTLLIQDLRRTRLGYALAWIGLRVLTRSPVARVDGLRSVRSAFTIGEMRMLCGRSGIDEARVDPAWPQRLTVRWGRS